MSLMAVAQKNEFVVPGRAPSVRFVAFGDSSLQFELLVWIVRPDIKENSRFSDKSGHLSGVSEKRY